MYTKFSQPLLAEASPLDLCQGLSLKKLRTLKKNKKNNVIFWQVLIVMYLVGVVYLVSRQIYQATEDDEEDLIVMIDKKGKTDIKKLDMVINNEKEVFT